MWRKIINQILRTIIQYLGILVFDVDDWNK